MKERTQTILNIILEQGEVRVDELCAQFPQVSAVTIRRDLSELEDGRYILRTHGGARPYQSAAREPWYSERAEQNAAQKNVLARKALGLLGSTRCLYIDAGTTAAALARILPDEGLIVITSAVNSALELVTMKPLLQVILLGGSVGAKTLSCSGADALAQLDALNLDVAFMAASGYTHNGGFAVGDYHECELKRRVVSRARRKVLLLDSAKLGLSMPYTFARPREIDTLVTDDDFPREYREALRGELEIV